MSSVDNGTDRPNSTDWRIPGFGLETTIRPTSWTVWYSGELVVRLKVGVQIESEQVKSASSRLSSQLCSPPTYVESIKLVAKPIVVLSPDTLAFLNLKRGKGRGESKLASRTSLPFRYASSLQSLTSPI